MDTNEIADALNNIAAAIREHAEATQNVAMVLDRHDCGGIQHSQIDKLVEALSEINGLA